MPLPVQNPKQDRPDETVLGRANLDSLAQMLLVAMVIATLFLLAISVPDGRAEIPRQVDQVQVAGLTDGHGAEAAKKKSKSKKKPKKNPLKPKNLPKAKKCDLVPGATCDGATLEGQVITGKDLSGASLRFANLKKADLSGSNLSSAGLFGANLEGANLSGVNLTGADLSFARLRGAKVDGTIFDGATLSFTVMPDGSTPDKWCVIYQNCK